MEDNVSKDVTAGCGPGEGVNNGLPLLTRRQRAILSGVLADQWHLAALPVGTDAGLSRDQLGRRRMIVRDAQQGLVPMNLSGWLGHVPSNSECVLYHREYMRLEGMGLLERHNLRGGTRTSHLKLTPAGAWVAETLLGEESPAEDAGEKFNIDDLDMSSLPLEMQDSQDDVR